MRRLKIIGALGAANRTTTEAYCVLLEGEHAHGVPQR
jgi:hypothetical protein